MLKEMFSFGNSRLRQYISGLADPPVAARLRRMFAA